jgi:hypothetical protein
MGGFKNLTPRVNDTGLCTPKHQFAYGIGKPAGRIGKAVCYEFCWRGLVSRQQNLKWRGVADLGIERAGRTRHHHHPMTGVTLE